MRLTQKIFTVPNALTTARIMLSPVIGYCLLKNMYEPALALTLANGTTDFLDGWYARKYKATSNLGKLLDPIADKFFIFSTIAPLVYTGIIPVYLGGIIIVRDVTILFGSYKYYSSKHFIQSRFRPTFLSKINTSIQISYIIATIASNAVDVFKGNNYFQFIELMKVLVCSTSIATSMQYFSIFRRLTSIPKKS